MIDVKDRVPSQVLPNGAIRYEEFDAEGNSLGYKYIKRADEPTEVGTPINKVLFDSIKNDILDRLLISDKATSEEAVGGTNDDKYMTALKSLNLINAKALPSKQMSIKTGTISNNGVIPQTGGFSNHLYFVSIPDKLDCVPRDHEHDTCGFKIELSVNQATRKVTSRLWTYWYASGNSNGYDLVTNMASNYVEIAWN